MSKTPAEAPSDCALCPRLSAFVAAQRVTEPAWHNAPVPSFGDANARLLVVGLAPGLRGANRTGRPFTGDFAGDLLYRTLAEFGFSRGIFKADPQDGLQLVDCMLTNAVRCVPPQNKPTPAEIKTCRRFLDSRAATLSRLSAVVCLGRVSHESTVRSFGLTPARVAFSHGASHDIGGGRRLFDSYHCSRYNTNTGVLTPDMFRDVFRAVRHFLDDQPNGVGAVSVAVPRGKSRA